MSDVFSDLFKRFGFKSILFALVFSIVIWFLAHIFASPGTEVSILLGLVRYTKSIDKNSDYSKPSYNNNNLVYPQKETVTSKKEKFYSPISIMVESELSNSKKDDAIIHFRKENNVRELNALESGKPPRDLPDGIYSYVFASWISTDDFKSVKAVLLNLTSSRFKSMDSDFEIHYVNKDSILIIGFTNKKDASEISFLSGKESHSIIISPSYFGDFNTVVALPADRIISSKDRSIEVSKRNFYTVLDVIVK